jgi:two-component system sensor histidine kinase MtrB
VFDRFYKVDTARARSEGSGLGLAIAWENARLHGGHIEAGNHPGGGALFTVSLPLNGHNPMNGRTPQAAPAGLQGGPEPRHARPGLVGMVSLMPGDSSPRAAQQP